MLGNLGHGDWVNSTSDADIMYKTTDDGDTWTVVNNIPAGSKGICGIQAIDEDHIYGVGRYDGPSYFIKSDDGGATWTVKDLNEGGLVDLHFFDADTGFVTCK